MTRDRTIGRRGLLGVGLALLATANLGCSQVGPDPQAEAVAKQAYQHLVLGEDDALENLMLPAVRKPGMRPTLALMRGMIPKSELQSVEQVNWRVDVGTGGRTTTFQHAYHYGSQVVTATSVLKSAPEGWRLWTFHVNTSFTGDPATAPQPEKASG